MTDLLEETTRDFKDEQRVMLFRKLLPYIILCSAVIAAGLWYNDWREDKKLADIQAFGDKYLMPYVMGDIPDIVPTVESEINASELLILKKLTDYLQQNDNSGALQFINTILDNNDIHDVTRGFISVTFINLILDEHSVTEQDRKRVQDIFQSYDDVQNALDKNQAFAISISMAKVMWLMKEQDFAAARTLMEELLSIQQLSDEMRMRAIALKNEIDRLENAQ